MMCLKHLISPTAYKKNAERHYQQFKENKPQFSDSIFFLTSLLIISIIHFLNELAMNEVQRDEIRSTVNYFSFFPLLALLLISAGTRSQQVSPQRYINEPAAGVQTEGDWSGVIRPEGFVDVSFRKQGGRVYSSIRVPLSELKDLPRQNVGTFTLTREAGSIQFSGRFENNEGKGQYSFAPEKSYTDHMRNENIDISDSKYQMAFFLVNITRSYVGMLKNNGYMILSKDDLIPLAALDVNEAYIRSIKNTGITSLSIHDFIPFRALKIDKEYIDTLRKAGYADLTAEKVINLKAKDFIK